jgi:hypothetical protein
VIPTALLLGTSTMPAKTEHLRLTEQREMTYPERAHGGSSFVCPEVWVSIRTGGRSTTDITFSKGDAMHGVRGWALVVGLGLSAFQSQRAVAKVTFVFTFFDVTTGTGVGFDDPVAGAARRAALEATAMAMGERIEQTATVEVGVAPSEVDGTGPIGIGSATFLDTSAGIRDGEVYRRIVMGLPDTDPGLDAGIVFDFGYDVALSGTPAAGVAYFPDVARHELTHALGFGSFLKSDGTGFNGTKPDMYTRFDSLLTTDAGPSAMGLAVVDVAGNLLLDMATYASAHGSGLVFDGPASRAANGGAPLKLFGADPTHSAASSDVMFPSPAVGTVRDDWTAFDVAALTDLGYTILPPGTGSMGAIMSPAACGTCAPAASPFIAFILAGIGGMKRSRRSTRLRR